MLGRQVLGPLDRLIHRPPSPDQAVYSLVERQNILAEEVKNRMRMSQAKQARYYNYHRKYVQFQPGDLVWLKTHPLSSASNKFSAKLVPKWEGPAEIKSKIGPINYTVCWGNPPKTVVINVVNLKHYYGCSPPMPLTGGYVGAGGLCSTATQEGDIYKAVDKMLIWLFIYISAVIIVSLFVLPRRVLWTLFLLSRVPQQCARESLFRHGIS